MRPRLAEYEFVELPKTLRGGVWALIMLVCLISPPLRVSREIADSSSFALGRWIPAVLIPLALLACPRSRSGYATAFAGLVLLAAFCWLYGFIEPSEQRVAAVLMSVHLLVGLLAGQLMRIDDAERLVIMVGCLQAAAVFLQTALQSGGIRSADLFRPGGMQMDTFSTSFILALAVIGLLGRVIQGPTFWPLVGWSLFCTALLLTWARSACLATAVACIWLAVRYRSEFRSKLKIIYIVVVSCIVVLICFSQRSSTLERSNSTARSNFGRLKQMSTALEEIRKRPMGVGPALVGYTVEAIHPNGQRIYVNTVDTKNQFLMSVLVFGPLGLLVPLALTACVISRFKESRSGRFAVLEGGWVGILLLCLFDAPFFHVGHLSCTALLGLYSSLTLKDPQLVQTT